MTARMTVAMPAVRFGSGTGSKICKCLVCCVGSPNALWTFDSIPNGLRKTRRNNRLDLPQSEDSSELILG